MLGGGGRAELEPFPSIPILNPSLNPDDDLISFPLESLIHLYPYLHYPGLDILPTEKGEEADKLFTGLLSLFLCFLLSLIHALYSE